MSATRQSGSESHPAHSMRAVRRIVRGMPTSDGAGVKLTRLLGSPDLPDLDPFLLLDQFGTDRPEDYLAGFPDHPHRGFETVTYMLEGRMRHRDNRGNQGLLVPGSVQWMSAGSGLVHSEMPEQVDGAMRGFQLWVNLPAKDKMQPPRYQEFTPDRIPQATPADGVRAKVIAGRIGEVIGPVRDVAAHPVYLDIALDGEAEYLQALPPGHAAFACVYEGTASLDAAETPVAAVSLAVFGDGDAVRMRAGKQGARLILVAGKPFKEPVARYGPFVMNTREEIMQAVEDFRAGRF
jgi:redox-sensitive bicupin YhaK (pirin superfamily)